MWHCSVCAFAPLVKVRNMQMRPERDAAESAAPCRYTARPPHKEQGCSERASACSRRERSRPGSETRSTLSFASPSRQTALIFSSPHGSLSLSANRSARSAKIRESPPPLRPLYNAIALSFRWAFIFCIALRFCCCRRESPEKVFYLHLLYMRCCATLEARAANILSALQIMSGH